MAYAIAGRSGTSTLWQCGEALQTSESPCTSWHQWGLKLCALRDLLDADQDVVGNRWGEICEAAPGSIQTRTKEKTPVRRRRSSPQQSLPRRRLSESGAWVFQCLQSMRRHFVLRYCSHREICGFCALLSSSNIGICVFRYRWCLHQFDFHSHPIQGHVWGLSPVIIIFECFEWNASLSWQKLHQDI